MVYVYLVYAELQPGTYTYRTITYIVILLRLTYAIDTADSRTRIVQNKQPIDHHHRITRAKPKKDRKKQATGKKSLTVHASMVSALWHPYSQTGSVCSHIPQIRHVYICMSMSIAPDFLNSSGLNT